MSDQQITIIVDDQPLTAEAGEMLIKVIDRAGLGSRVPRFCYHPMLSIAGNCRMCMVEVDGINKPIPACQTPVNDGMKVSTGSELAVKARHSVMEFLLINHPLDCPICDQGGECELQDVAVEFGGCQSRYQESKRAVANPDLGSLVATNLTRCIHCMRCVRFLEEVAGKRELGSHGRGEYAHIGTAKGQPLSSELSGNIIDLCPVGALTSKPYRYQARAWELKRKDGIAMHDCIGSNIQIHTKDHKIKRVLPRANAAINEVWLSDRDRFGYAGASVNRLENPRVKVDGNWQTCSWDEALSILAEKVCHTLENDGVEQIGTLISPNCSYEEMALAAQVTRGIGSNHIDHRLRCGDFSDQACECALPKLAIPLPDFELQDLIFLIGSQPRYEQPMLAHRLRRAKNNGAKLLRLNPRKMDERIPFDVDSLVHPEQMIASLLGIIKQVVRVTHAGLPKGVEELVKGSNPTETEKAIAASLFKGEKRQILLGNLVEYHPQGGMIRSLASLLAEMTNAGYSYITSGSNALAGWFAGALPHQSVTESVAMPGMNAREMLMAGLKHYLLVGIEPGFDTWIPARALAAFNNADWVTALTPYVSDELEQCCDLLLPVAGFAESDGTMINAQGDWQGYRAAVSPYDQALPISELLCRIAKLLGVEIQELEQTIDLVASDKYLTGFPVSQEGEPSLIRFSDIHPYFLDAQLRRSQPLQDVETEAFNGVRVNPDLAARNGWENGEVITVKQADQICQREVVIDPGVADHCLWLTVGDHETKGFGCLVGLVEVIKGDES